MAIKFGTVVWTGLIWLRIGTSGGRVIAQAVSRRLPTAVARARARIRLCGICGGQSGTGAGFLRVLRFPLPIVIPPIAPQSSSSITWGWYNRTNSGRSTKWTQSDLMRKIKKKIRDLWRALVNTVINVRVMAVP
jgi:hypothetical protein